MKPASNTVAIAGGASTDPHRKDVDVLLGCHSRGKPTPPNLRLHGFLASIFDEHKSHPRLGHRKFLSERLTNYVRVSGIRFFCKDPHGTCMVMDFDTCLVKCIDIMSRPKSRLTRMGNNCPLLAPSAPPGKFDVVLPWERQHPGNAAICQLLRSAKTEYLHLNNRGRETCVNRRQFLLKLMLC